MIAELTLNRMATTGRRGQGLLDLMEHSLGPKYSKVGSGAYLFLHYAVMVAYIAQGGSNIDAILNWNVPDGTSQIAFAGVTAAALYNANAKSIEKANNALVLGVVTTFVAICAAGASSADYSGLLSLTNQHPEHTVDCFPILFLSLVYQNIVPSVVDQLEGDRKKVTQAIVGGTLAPLLLFLSWNAVVLGNVGAEAGLSNIDPVALFQSSENGLLGPLVTTFSSLAIVTSMIGFCYGLRDAWTDILKVDINSADYERNVKLPLYLLIFGPPLGLACANPSIFFDALDYGGAFGVSTLFLILPPLMVWSQRYGDDQPPLATKPIIPLGKIPLASMYKAAGTLIIEQGADKLGVFTFLQNHVFSHFQLPFAS